MFNLFGLVRVGVTKVMLVDNHLLAPSWEVVYGIVDEGRHVASCSNTTKSCEQKLFRLAIFLQFGRQLLDLT